MVRTLISCISDVFLHNSAANPLGSSCQYVSHQLLIGDTPCIVFLVEMDCIEFAAGGAKTASDADVAVYPCCTALEAAGCFRFNLLFREWQTLIPEGFCFALIYMMFVTFCAVISG